MRIVRGEAAVAGVLSGTSADGVDVALARFRAPGGRLALFEVLGSCTRPFPGQLGGRLRAVLDGAPCGLREAALLHRDLALAFADSVEALAVSLGVRPELVGSHGQTVYHHDGIEPSGAATLQLGDGDWIAERLGCPVVSDFRQRDIAAGGGGAPLSGYADDLLFAHVPEPLCVLNLGGMANLTWRQGEQLLVLDTGPAGALLDGLTRRFWDMPFDRDGARAARGRILPELLAKLLEHPFLSAPAPKSTGRDTFGAAWIDSWLDAWSAAACEDILATGVALVAESVARAVATCLPAQPTVIHVAGGGVHNRTLMVTLRERLPCSVRSSAEVGVDPDGREALLFAGLAVRWVLGQGVTRRTATGAADGRLLGKLSPPNRCR